jgi:hypothetical protein
VKASKALAVAALILVVVTGLVAGVITLWANSKQIPLIPVQDHCEATVNGEVTTVDLEQARNAAIITGVSIKRGLKPRAASIALATAYQESDIRNLDYGHSDSLGLFQQRTSQGWGTTAQIMDPWYSSKAFYQALVKVKNWQTGDINNVAQKVQRSAYPDAYRKHVAKAKVLASSLTGETPASFSCVANSPAASDAAGMKTFLSKSLGATATITTTDTGLKVVTKTPQNAWAVAHLAIGAASDYGLLTVNIGTSSWARSTTALPAWSGTSPSEATEVALGFTTATAK